MGGQRAARRGGEAVQRLGRAIDLENAGIVGMESLLGANPGAAADATP